MSTTLITQSFRERIEERVRAYERDTSVEFVNVIVRQSAEYDVYRGYGAMAVYALCLALLPLWPHHWSWGLGATIAAIPALVAYAIFAWEPILRAIVPRAVRLAEVEEGAALSFLKEEVFATRARTGVLVYISLFERAVYVLADKALTAKIPHAEWAQLGARLAADFNRKAPGATFLEALDEIVKKLAKDFPPDADNPNELPDGVRER